PKETAGLDCYYYSFATLTTLGYGDITPVADYAKILAILEAVAGPVYLAIFVAQIIGMNIAQKMKS
ncbi:MAG: potassium channel family protein, partial [Planctomycetota bacterium]